MQQPEVTYTSEGFAAGLAAAVPKARGVAGLLVLWKQQRAAAFLVNQSSFWVLPGTILRSCYSQEGKPV